MGVRLVKSFLTAVKNDLTLKLDFKKNEKYEYGSDY